MCVHTRAREKYIDIEGERVCIGFVFERDRKTDQIREIVLDVENEKLRENDRERMFAYSSEKKECVCE